MEEIVVLLLVEVHVLVRLVVGAAAVVVDGALAASRARRRPSLSRRPARKYIIISLDRAYIVHKRKDYSLSLF